MAARKAAALAPATTARRSARIREAALRPKKAQEQTRVTKTVRQPKRAECSTCSRKLAASSFPKITAQCKHAASTCKACVKNWLAISLNSNTFDKVACPECPERMQNEDMKKHAAKDVYERYDELERKDIAEKIPGWRWCLKPDCRAGKVHEPLLPKAEAPKKKRGVKKTEEEEDDGVDICVCGECGAKACVPCDKPYHEGRTCEQYQKQAQKEEQATLKTIKKQCKACPGCQKNIEKNGGCDSVYCKSFSSRHEQS